MISIEFAKSKAFEEYNIGLAACMKGNLSEAVERIHNALTIAPQEIAAKLISYWWNDLDQQTRTKFEESLQRVKTARQRLEKFQQGYDCINEDEEEAKKHFNDFIKDEPDLLPDPYLFLAFFAARDIYKKVFSNLYSDGLTLEINREYEGQLNPIEAFENDLTFFSILKAAAGYAVKPIVNKTAKKFPNYRIIAQFYRKAKQIDRSHVKNVIRDEKLRLSEKFNKIRLPNSLSCPQEVAAFYYSIGDDYYNQSKQLLKVAAFLDCDKPEARDPKEILKSLSSCKSGAYNKLDELGELYKSIKNIAEGESVVALQTEIDSIALTTIKQQVLDIARSAIHHAVEAYENAGKVFPRFIEPLQKLVAINFDDFAMYKKALRLMFNSKRPLGIVLPNLNAKVLSDHNGDGFSKLLVRQEECAIILSLGTDGDEVRKNDTSPSTLDILRLTGFDAEDGKELFEYLKDGQFLRYALKNDRSLAERLLEEPLPLLGKTKRFADMVNELMEPLLKAMIYGRVSPIPKTTNSQLSDVLSLLSALEDGEFDSIPRRMIINRGEIIDTIASELRKAYKDVVVINH